MPTLWTEMKAMQYIPCSRLRLEERQNTESKETWGIFG